MRPLSDGDSTPRVTYVSDSEELASEAIINAFAVGDIEGFHGEETLYDQINPDAIDGFDWHTDPPLHLTTVLWEHRVVLTPNTVHIYQHDH